MRTIVKKILIAALAVSIMIFTPQTVSAEIRTMSDGGQFDPQFYANSYPDVAAAFGTDVNALYNHYLQFGKNEGRQPYDVQNLNDTSVPLVASPSVQSSSSTDIASKIAALRVLYPNGTRWDLNSIYTSINARIWAPATTSACQAFAYLVQDQLFGNTPITRESTYLIENVIGNNGSYQISTGGNDNCWVITGYKGDNQTVNTNFEKIYNELQLGDVICDSIHASVVITKSDKGITTVGGNVHVNNGPGTVFWDKFISKDSLRRGLTEVESAY